MQKTHPVMGPIKARSGVRFYLQIFKVLKRRL